VIPDIPIAALALLVGVDRFMSECRALTNLVGNGVGALVIARWEGDLTAAELREALAGSAPNGEPPVVAVAAD
jgi:aerobic C4-dicarboxylate transport protein